MKTDPNAPAYPVSADEMRNSFSSHGLTKRELFAVMIMAAYRSNGNAEDLPTEDHAKDACYEADALIAALNAQKEDGT